MKIKFLGASRQVTGSCYLLEADGLRLLVDCGLFQERDYLYRNWDPFPVPPDTIDGIFLTHAHLDHSGLLPKLVKEGYTKKIFMTSATADLLEIVLLDSGRIQEEDAAYKKKRHQKEGRKGPHPEIPLYTVEDAERVFPLVDIIGYKETVTLDGGANTNTNTNVNVRFLDAGHILGSSTLDLRVSEEGNSCRFIFSGDLGQWDKPLVRDPSVFEKADYVVMESTYGDRRHDDPADVETLLCRIVNETVERGGNIVIPTFAIERAQELMFYLSRLVRKKCIPPLLTFLDSPMAQDVTRVFEQHEDFLDRESRERLRRGDEFFNYPGLKMVQSIEESKAINRIKGSCIILAGSGMATGGRIKHHLVHNISRPESTVLFVGFQARGTLGRQILDGNPQVRIYGQSYPVRARIEQIHGFSAHADRQDLIRWLSHIQTPPRKVFLIHGEEDISLKLAEWIEKEKGWPVEVPEYLEEIDLGVCSKP